MRYVAGGQSAAGAHRIETFNACPRKWALRHAAREAEHAPVYPTKIGGLRESAGSAPLVGSAPDGADPAGVPRISSYGNIVDTGEAMMKGTLYHAMLQHHYLILRARQRGDDVEADSYMDPLSALWECARRGEIEQPHAAWQPLAARLAGYGALDPYCDHWGDTEQDWEIIGVECEFSTEIVVPPAMLPSMVHDRYLFTQRADLVVRSKATNRIYVVDHKSCGRYYPGTISRYALSTQRLGYNLHGRRTYGGRYGGVIYNFIQFPNESARTPLGWRFDRPEMPDVSLPEDNLIRTILDVERRIEWMRRQHGGRLPTDPMQWPGVFRSGEPCVGIRAEANCALLAQCTAGTMDIQTQPDFTIALD